MCLRLNFLTDDFNCLITSKPNIPRALLCVHITGLNEFNNDNSSPEEVLFEEKEEGTQKLSPPLGEEIWEWSRILNLSPIPGRRRSGETKVPLGEFGAAYSILG